MVDHYFDKLLHIANCYTGNEYFDTEARLRVAPIAEVALAFGTGGPEALDAILAGAEVRADEEAQRLLLAASSALL